MLMTHDRRTFLLLGAFALAMAHVEASLVVHLRTLYYGDDPLVLFPLTLLPHRTLAIEVAREAATLVMILAVALLAARGAGRVFAAFCYVFGLWDIGYYLWLKLMLGWPVRWLEWDVLFLIPWPWFGPWLAAALIALLLSSWGARVLLAETTPVFGRAPLLLFVAGVLLALGAFLWPAALLLPGGEQAFAGFRPETFPWLPWLGGLILMAVGLWRALRRSAPPSAGDVDA